MIVFLVEEPSMKTLLEILLPNFLGEIGIDFNIIAFEGKTRLQKSIRLKLSAMNKRTKKFVILHDQDRSDCRELKAKIKNLVPLECQDKTIIRIVCQELESWFLGDFDALSTVYGEKINKTSKQAKYRNPDTIVFPSKELKTLIPDYIKGEGARSIASHLNLKHEHNRSDSFNVFIKTLDSLAKKKWQP